MGDGDLAGCAVAVLDDRQVGLAHAGVVAFVGVGSVQEDDDVGGLHDGVPVLEVADPGWSVPGPEVGAGRSWGSFQFGGGDDVDAQLHRQVFQAAQDLGHVALSRVGALAGEDEAGRVDGDEVEPVAGHCRGDRRAERVEVRWLAGVEVQRGVGQPAQGVGEGAPLRVVEPAALQVDMADAGGGADDAQDQFVLGGLERVHARGRAVCGRGVGEHVEHEGAAPGARSGRDDAHRPGAEAAGQRGVQVSEPGGQDLQNAAGSGGGVCGGAVEAVQQQVAVVDDQR